MKHHEREWLLDSLNETDRAKAAAIEALSVDTFHRLRLLESSPSLRLKLWLNAANLCELAYPMAVKIPIISVKWFLNIHAEFAFNEVRKSSMKLENDIVDYLYELLFLQQKTIVSISDYLQLASAVIQDKEVDVGLMKAEVDTWLRADLSFTYLKSSVEKTISLLGAMHGEGNLSGKKAHKDRLRALSKCLPDEAKKTEYFQFVWDAISSDNLDELNKYRSGLLHKKGIADLQPHNYVGIPVEDLPFLKVFTVLHHQHAINTLLLMAVLAMLTDELVNRDPDFNPHDSFSMWLLEQLHGLVVARGSKLEGYN